MRRLFSFFMCFILLVSSIFATAIQGFCAEGENFSLYSSDGGNALCEASVKGIHHYPNVAYGSTLFSALNAAESSGTYTFNTDSSEQTRIMSEDDAPIAVYYFDVTKSNTVSIPLSFQILDKTYCDVMNYCFTVSEAGYTMDCEGQQYVDDEEVGYTAVHRLTGPAPSSVGQSIDVVVGMWTDIAQESTFTDLTYIHALSKIKIRLVGYGASTVDGSIDISNKCTRNYPYVYTTDRTLKVYNVNSGTSASYENSTDGDVSLTNEHFPVYSTAYACAYVDSTKYSDLNQTPIEFSHDVQSLCGCGGWSWTDILVSSDYSTYSASRNLHYTVASSDYVSPIYYLPFKLNGKVPARGETAVITVTSRCNSLGHNSPEQIFYNSDANIVLTVYGIDKTELKAAIDTIVGDNHPEDNYSAYLSALETATAVYNNATSSQSEIDKATNALNKAIREIDAVPPILLSLTSDSALTIKDHLLYGDFSSVGSLADEFDNTELFFYSKNGMQTEMPVELKSGIRIAVKTEGEITDYADLVILGDVNGDGRVDGQDSVAADLIVKFGSDIFPPYCAKAADVNEDGRVSDYDVIRLSEIGAYLADEPLSITPDFIGEYDIVVSCDGDDSADGTYQYPLKTIAAAKEYAKSLKQTVSEPINIWLRQGTYRLSSALNFNSEDMENVTYKAFPSEKVEISGADQISGFSETTVNGVRAFVVDYAYDGDTDGHNTLYNGNVRLKRPTWPESGEFNVDHVNSDDAINVGNTYYALNTAFYAKTSEILNFRNIKDVDVRIMHWWKDELLPIDSVDISSGRITVQKAASMTVNAGDRFLYENVFETLNSPGEWYFDRTEQKLYYIPFDGETAETTVLHFGKINQLIKIDGCDGISFDGITFRDTDWRMQSGENANELSGALKYYSDMSQACFDVPCAVTVERSKNVAFKSCDFHMIGGSGLRFGNGTSNCSVTATRFKDIGGNAVYIRGVNDQSSTDKTHDITVKDCLIETYGRIFNNAVGILLIHAYNCNLEYNEIHDGYYTGISCGWVWGYSSNISNNNLIANNLIYDIGQGWLSDMGGIYTLGMQPDTVIRNNVVYNVGCSNDSKGYGGWGIYLDEGSSGIDVFRNLVYNCSSDGFHQHYGKFNNIYNNIFALNGEAQMKLSKVESHPSFGFTRNILLADNTSMYANCVQNSFTDNANIYWDLTRKDNVYSGSLNKSTVQSRGFYNNGVFENPMFTDPYSFDFTFTSDEAIHSIGFVKWDYSTVGTLTDFSYLYGGSGSDKKSTSVMSLHNYHNVATGGSVFTLFGADEISFSEYMFSVNDTVVTREMDSTDAPTATFFINTKEADSVRIKLGFEISNKDFCDTMNYHYRTSDARYVTSAPSQVFVNRCPVGTKRINYLTGPAPKKVGETVEFTVTLWTDMACESTYSPTTFIHSGTKIKIRLVGV